MKLPPLQPEGGVEEKEPGFQAVGSVELKKAKTGLAGILSWRKKKKAPSSTESSNAEERSPSSAPPSEEGFVDGFQASVWDQIDDLREPGGGDLSEQGELELDVPQVEAPPLASPVDGPRGGEVSVASGGAAHQIAAKQEVMSQSLAAPLASNDRAYNAAQLPLDRGTILIGAPPLEAVSIVPEVIHALPNDKRGLIGTLSYGLKAPKIAQRQRNRIRTLNTQLTKHKKKEREVVAALGRASRVHKLSSTEGLSVPDIGDESQRPDGYSPEEARLLELGHQHENMVAHLEIAQRTLAQGEQQMVHLRQREQELRSPPAPGLSEAEAATRVKEYEEVKAARAKAEGDLERLQEKVAAARQPLQRIKDEIAQLRQGVQSANVRKMVSRAKAAKASAEKGGGSNADEALGQRLLDSPGAAQPLRQLIVSAETSRRRVSRWEDALEKQQAELSRFDEGRARTGFWMLMGAILGGLVIILGSGELVRRLLLSM